MRSKDIRIGERYVARHRGATIIVTIDEVIAPAKAGDTSRVVATNNATSEQIEFASTLNIMRPAGPYISEVKTIEDLLVEQIAVPEPGVRYRLRRVDEVGCFAVVDYVIRRSNCLFAKTDHNTEYPITGEGACVLVPSR